jgi:hypothetical protein
MALNVVSPPASAAALIARRYARLARGLPLPMG